MLRLALALATLALILAPARAADPSPTTSTTVTLTPVITTTTTTTTTATITPALTPAGNPASLFSSAPPHTSTTATSSSAATSATPKAAPVVTPAPTAAHTPAATPAAPTSTTATAAATPAIRTVAHFHLTGQLTETPILDPFGFTGAQTASIRSLVARIDRASTDTEIDGVALSFDAFVGGKAQLEELRAALARVRAAGKPVFIHAIALDTTEYQLASVADRLSLEPNGDLLLTGLYGESLYLKGLLDKLGVASDWVQSGAYKSAGELFGRTGPSPAADANLNWLFDSLYQSLVAEIADGRGLPRTQVQERIDRGPYTAAQALEAGLIDAVETRPQFMQAMKDRLGPMLLVENRYGRERNQADINPENPFAIFGIFAQMMAPPPPTRGDTIGVVYIEGPILSGYRGGSFFGADSGAFSGNIRHALERAAKDPAIKAVVLRIDSPGGSAVASEEILAAARALVGSKPVVASFGNVAASGGYYVACRADRIFADRQTITASIGAIGGKLVTTGLWDKLGVAWVPYRRGANAGFLSSSATFTASERTRMEELIHEVDSIFRGHVADGRAGRLVRPIDEIAGGRVYTGAQALDLGLVDEIGGVTDAIQWAAAQAKLGKYEIAVLPEPINPFAFFGEAVGRRDSPSDLAIDPEALRLLSAADPAKAQALRHALAVLGLMRTETVLTIMPLQVVLD